MVRSQFTDYERRLATERRQKFRGTAKINLDQICFDPEKLRGVDSRNVERIYRIFHKEKCRRLDIQNHVTAVISTRDLEMALRISRVSAEALLTHPNDAPPHLQFPTGQVWCLHGLHRIKAAEEVLGPSDRWWTVDIYLDGMLLPRSHLHPIVHVSFQTSVPSCERPSPKSIQTRSSHQMVKYTARSASMSTSIMLIFKNDGGPDCLTIKPSVSGSSQ